MFTLICNTSFNINLATQKCKVRLCLNGNGATTHISHQWTYCDATENLIYPHPLVKPTCENGKTEQSALFCTRYFPQISKICSLLSGGCALRSQVLLPFYNFCKSHLVVRSVSLRAYVRMSFIMYNSFLISEISSLYLSLFQVGYTILVSLHDE